VAKQRHLLSRLQSILLRYQLYFKFIQIYSNNLTSLFQLCIGTGVLALPHATYRGGLLFSLLVMALVAAWNGTACKMIIDSKNHSLDKTVPADISSTYSRIAYIALGNWGVRITDFSVIVTLLGVCIAYQITFATLLQQVPGIGLSKVSLTLLCGLLVLPISLYRDIGFLSNFSFIALVCLVLSVFVIIFYGAWNYGMETLRDPFHSSYSTHSLNLFPQSIDDMTIFIGVATFCYGLCSMVCPIEESMAKREEFQQAVNWSLIFVWSVYGIIGTVGALLFFHHPDGIQDNILLNLPQDSLVATIVRVSMALVCILTFPLAFCAPAEMLEYKLSQLGSYMTSVYYQGYERIHTAEDDDKTTTSNTTTVTMTQSILRISLILLTTVLASTVPCFEMVSLFCV